MNSKKLKSLITLLNDEDSNISGAAMSELLSHDSDLNRINPIMAELQETPDRGLRKKVHQMQAILRTRRRRRRLTQRFSNKEEANLLQGLADLNLIWYDEFGVSELSRIWRDLIVKVAKNRPKTTKKLASFMQKTGFAVYEDSIQDADLFCVGAVIEDRIGADIILASITMEIGKICGLHGAIVHTEKGFAVLISNFSKEKNDSDPYYGEIILPTENWKVVKPETELPFEIWSNSKVLRYVTAMLFANSVCSEGPRYVQILGACLAGRTERETLTDILPYPFGEKKTKR